jgi:hypothetical protein
MRMGKDPLLDISDTFLIPNGLKQGDASTPLFLNFALEKFNKTK